MQASAPEVGPRHLALVAAVAGITIGARHMNPAGDAAHIGDEAAQHQGRIDPVDLAQAHELGRQIQGDGVALLLHGVDSLR